MYDSESSSEAGWIDWFCDLEGHEFFVSVSLAPLKLQIDAEYIRDSFNLYGLKERIPKYK